MNKYSLRERRLLSNFSSPLEIFKSNEERKNPLLQRENQDANGAIPTEVAKGNEKKDETKNEKKQEDSVEARTREYKKQAKIDTKAMADAIVNANVKQEQLQKSAEASEVRGKFIQDVMKGPLMVFDNSKPEKIAQQEIPQITRSNIPAAGRPVEDAVKNEKADTDKKQIVKNEQKEGDPRALS